MFIPRAASPTSSTTAPATAAGRPPTSVSCLGAATGYRQTGRGAWPIRCWATSPAAATRRTSAPRPAACPLWGKPSMNSWRPIPTGRQPPTRAIATSSSAISATGSAVPLTPSLAVMSRPASTALPRKAVGRRPTARSRCYARPIAGPASITTACATRSIYGLPPVASSIARGGARYRRRPRCCRAGARASRPWSHRRSRGTPSGSASTLACASTRCCCCDGIA